MNEEQFIELASRYVAGTASAEEIEQIDALLREPRFAELFRKVNTTWLNAGRMIRKKRYDTDRGLDRLAERLRQHEPAFRWGPNRRRFPQPASFSMYYAIAASIVAVLLISTLLLHRTENDRTADSTTWSERSTRMGEKAMVVLPEGSTVTLNGGSRLKYPARFDGGSRDLYLEGEAYFDIKHDPAHPCIIHTSSVTTTDLGTKFNIRAFPSDPSITVSLEEGSVEIASRNDAGQSNGVVLTPMHQFVMDRRNGASDIRPFALRAVSGWRTDQFVYDNAPLAVVFNDMERSYGVKFEVADSSFARRRIRADFKNESVWTVAKILKKATGLSYIAVKDGDTLTKFIFSKY